MMAERAKPGQRVSAQGVVSSTSATIFTRKIPGDQTTNGVKVGVRTLDDFNNKRGVPGTNPQIGTYRDRDLKWTSIKKCLVWSMQVHEAFTSEAAVSTEDLYVWINTLMDAGWYDRYQEREGVHPMGTLAVAFMLRGWIKPEWWVKPGNGATGDGISQKNVRHYCYHMASDPMSEWQIPGEGGYVSLLHMGGRDYKYYLTTKGQSVDVEGK
jgi:hypothetical protein